MWILQSSVPILRYQWCCFSAWMRISNSNSEATVLIGKRGFPALGWAGVHKPWVILTLGNEGAGNWQVDQWNVGTDTNAVSISCLQRWACVELLVDLYPHLWMWVNNDWGIRLMFGCLKINVLASWEDKKQDELEEKLNNLVTSSQEHLQMYLYDGLGPRCFCLVGLWLLGCC